MAQYHLRNIDDDLMKAGKVRAARMGVTFKELLVIALERFADPDSVVKEWFDGNEEATAEGEAAIEYALGERHDD